MIMTEHLDTGAQSRDFQNHCVPLKPASEASGTQGPQWTHHFGDASTKKIILIKKNGYDAERSENFTKCYFSK